MKRAPATYPRTSFFKPRFLLPALLIETCLITGAFLMESRAETRRTLSIEFIAQLEIVDEQMPDIVAEAEIAEASPIGQMPESLSPPRLENPLLPLPEHIPARDTRFVEELMQVENEVREEAWLEPLRQQKSELETPESVSARPETTKLQQDPSEKQLALVDGFNVWPLYPRRALELGHEGKLLIKLHVDGKGRVTRVELVQSTCSRPLERSAKKSLAKWRFIGGPGVFIQVVVFRLSDSSVGGG